MLTGYDWITIGAPILLAILGAWISVRPPAKKYHLVVAIALIVVGAMAGGSALYQIRQTRKSDDAAKVAAKTSEDSLRATITGLRNQVTVLSETSIPALVGDVKERGRNSGLDGFLIRIGRG